MNTNVLSRKPVAPAPGAQAPARVLEIEIGQPLPPLSAFDERTGHHYRRALCLVRLHSQPLGLVELQLGERGLGAGEYAPHIWRTLGEQINEHLRQDGLPAVSSLDGPGLSASGIPACLEQREHFLAHAPFVSVIIPTRDRPERIQACLRSLLAVQYPKYEVIVVDNAPGTSATEDFVRQTYSDVAHVRYVLEDHAGVSRARNRGMMAARGEILVYTDDDVVIDRYWLAEMVRAFTLADEVACVTGLILPLELETPAQFLIEEYGGFSKGFSRRVFDMAEHHPKTPLYPFTAGGLGTGASMAFKTSFLRGVGGFDVALGPGTPAQGGEDLAAFFQVITRGHKLVYAPAAVAYHPHRRDYAALRKLIYHYGIGLAAYLTKVLCDNPRLLFDLIPSLPYGLFFTLSTRSPKNRKKTTHYPRELTVLELKGLVQGPFAYMRSRRVARSDRRAAARIEGVRRASSPNGDASILPDNVQGREERSVAEREGVGITALAEEGRNRE